MSNAAPRRSSSSRWVTRKPSARGGRQLATASANIFSTAEWTDVWWRHFGAGMALEPASVHNPEGETVAVLPLVRERRGPIAILRLAGHGVADEQRPVCATADREAATVSLADAGGYVLIAERLRSDWPRAALHGSVIREAESPVIARAAHGTWEDYLAARSSNFRQQVRRRARKLERGLELRSPRCRRRRQPEA